MADKVFSHLERPEKLNQNKRGRRGRGRGSAGCAQLKTNDGLSSFLENRFVNLSRESSTKPLRAQTKREGIEVIDCDDDSSRERIKRRVD